MWKFVEHIAMHVAWSMLAKFDILDVRAGPYTLNS